MTAIAPSSADLVPARGDRGLENIGGELERETCDQPTAQAKPDVALLVAVGRREHRPQPGEESLSRPDDNDD